MEKEDPEEEQEERKHLLKNAPPQQSKSGGYFITDIMLNKNCRTQIVGKGGLWVTSFIYKYETSTLTPFMKPHDVWYL